MDLHLIHGSSQVPKQYCLSVKYHKGGITQFWSLSYLLNVCADKSCLAELAQYFLCERSYF